MSSTTCSAPSSLSSADKNLLKQKKHLWTVEGKTYDFAEFAGKHPGGATFIMVGRGRDCTELFKSVHQLSDVQFAPLMAKYEVEAQLELEIDEDTKKKEFDWSLKSNFHHELKAQVKEYFVSNRLSTKAPPGTTAFFMMYFLLMIFLIFKTITERNLLISILAGALVMSCEFTIMHTASHGGLSHNSWINWIFFATFTNCFGWLHHIWLQHHVYAHHSYTGLYGTDPDTRNVEPTFLRKHVDNEYKPQHRFNVLIEPFFLLIFPSQFSGQGADYFVSLVRNTVFGMHISHFLTPLDSVVTFLQFSMWILCFVVVPISSSGLGHLLYTYAFYLSMGFFYWAFVIPNHETFEVHQNSISFEGHSSDWAVHQIVHSSNFAAPDWLTFCIGGMNYQIEHHLFPSVHQVHHPAISRIVQKLCKKHDIPYVMHQSWFAALFSHFKLLHTLSKPQIK